MRVYVCARKCVCVFLVGVVVGVLVPFIANAHLFYDSILPSIAFRIQRALKTCINSTTLEAHSEDKK